jgi:hypothetical protein
MSDLLLTWPPDVFALVGRILEISDAYRFVVSPPGGVDDRGSPGHDAKAIARDWWSWLDDEAAEPPPALTTWCGIAC